MSLSTDLKLILLNPQQWYSSTAKITGGIFWALIKTIADRLDYITQTQAYTKAQSRISTATDGNLDLIAFDYFGTTLKRNSGETDISFRARILANLFPEKATRKGVIQ